MPPCAFDCRPPALDFLKSVCFGQIILVSPLYMGLFYSSSMDIHFIDQANYYPETLHPLGQSSIGGVKTIRTLRSDAPLTVSDMKSSYLPDEAISRLGKGCSAPVSMDCARPNTESFTRRSSATWPRF